MEREAGLEQLTLGVGKAKVGKDVAATFLTRVLLFLFILVLPFSVILLSRGEPLSDEFHLSLRRGNALLRFLLEGVQHVNHIVKAHRVNRSEGVAFVGRDNLKHGAAAEAFESFDGGELLAALGLLNKLEAVGAGDRADPGVHVFFVLHQVAEGGFAEHLVYGDLDGAP